MSEVPVAVPSLAEQRAIAGVLGALDDKIELNRQMNHTLEEMASALFKSWFVDFDPVVAKAEGRQPFGMNAETAALFPNEIETDPSRGDRPRGWCFGQLADLAEILMGTSPPGETYNSSEVGLPLINGPAQFGEFFPSRSVWTTAPSVVSADHDLIFCVRGSTTGRYVEADGKFCLGRGVCAIRALGGHHEFVRQTVAWRLDDLLSRATGSTFPNLPGPTIKGLETIVPTGTVLAAFSSDANSWRTLQRANMGESRDLGLLRDALLPKLLSGEIRLKQAEKMVEAAL